MLDFNILSLKNAERCEKGFKHKIDSWTLSDWATAISGETGEMCNYVKKLKRLKDGVQPDKDKNLTETEIIANIGRELADIVIYADLMATRLNMKLGFEVIKKFNETSIARKSNIKL